MHVSHQGSASASEKVAAARTGIGSAATDPEIGSRKIRRTRMLLEWDASKAPERELLLGCSVRGFCFLFCFYSQEYDIKSPIAAQEALVDDIAQSLIESRIRTS